MKSMIQSQNSSSNSAFGTSNPRFVSRLFTDLSGRQFRMTFLVAVVNGELKGHLVSVQPVSASNLLSGNVQMDTCTKGVICLPIFYSEEKKDTAYEPGFVRVVSPYSELFFFTSQPTRAPSFAH